MKSPLRVRAGVLAATAALGLVVAAACRDGAAPQTEGTPTFTGRWAGRPWAGDAWALLVPGGATGDTLYVGGSHPVGAKGWPDQTIRLRALVSAPGTYALGADAVEVWDLLGGDVITATYTGSRPGAGTLHITAYGGPGGIVEGTLSFETQPTATAAPYGPRARFEDGWFRATIARPP